MTTTHARRARALDTRAAAGSRHSTQLGTQAGQARLAPIRANALRTKQGQLAIAASDRATGMTADRAACEPWLDAWVYCGQLQGGEYRSRGGSLV